jgi:hypothetical protein
MEILNYIIDWSEVWVLIIPIFIYLKGKSQPDFMKPVIIYIFLGFLFNLICDGMGEILEYIPPKYRTNTIIYNLNSVSRFILFVLFFFKLNQPFYLKIQRILVAIFILIFILYFNFIDSFFNTQHISSDLMAGEAFFLLFFSMLYYISLLNEENPSFQYRKDFWVTTGLSIYMAVNFFVFLFYNPLLNENELFAENIWTFHNAAYVIFILFLSKALYVSDPD